MSEAAQSSKQGAVLLEERAGAILTLRMNRPNRLNALNVDLGRALVESLRRASWDDSVRVIVLTGTGRGFCSGGDLAMLRDARERNAGHELGGLLRAAKEICVAIASMSKIVIAAVNGPAAGGGMNLALACDLRLAAETASFGESFALVGLYPDFGGTFYLPRLVGAAKAAELFLTGELISAAEALRLGIVNQVYPTDRFETEVRERANAIAAAPPLAARGIKQTLFGSELRALEMALDEETQRQVECFASTDCVEGFAAFFEKRRPVFHGR
ncbi:MAG: enoyl-CoA hydratase [Candidatus Acidiferrales bacterium]